jgi:hypothetical protein
VQIWLLEPYTTGSHRAWADGYAHYSGHQVTVLSLPGRWWQWRMHGAAVVEAIYCGCRPVLPDALAYPEHIPAEHHADCLYQGQEGLVALLRLALRQPALSLRPAVARYDWEEMAPRYDRALAYVAGSAS